MLFASLIVSVVCLCVVTGTKTQNFLRTSSLPGVALPPSNIFGRWSNFKVLASLTGKSTVDLGKFVFEIKDINIENVPKTSVEEINKFRACFIEGVIGDSGKGLPSDYEFFGEKNSNVEKLELLMKCNPLIASALSYNEKDGFHVESVGKGDSLFSTSIAHLIPAYPRINAKFSPDMKLMSYEMMTEDGKPWSEARTKEEAAGDLMYLLSYHFEMIHSTIHILHWLSVTGIYHATEHYDEFRSWTEPYYPNVAVKNEEVDLLLLSDNGALTSDLCWKTKNREEVLQSNIAILKTWTSEIKSADDFLENFLLRSCGKLGITKMKQNGVLAEYLKHIDLVDGYAKDVTDCFWNNDAKKMDEANTRLKNFNENVGENINAIDNAKDWLTIMSCTGMLHGATLSATRAAVSKELLSCFDPSTSTYGAGAQSALGTAGGTMVGLCPDRYVMCAKMHYDSKQKNVAGLKDTMEKYDGLTTAYKKEYYEKCTQDPDFSKYGWVWSDYFHGEIDAKQLTITTYI